MDFCVVSEDPELVLDPLSQASDELLVLEVSESSMFLRMDKLSVA